MSKDERDLKIVAFLCNWCSYAGADLAGAGKMEYPSNMRIIKVPCSGRIDPIFILKALRSGIDGVWISGCHPGECHYQTGNYYARRKFALTRKLLEFVGVDPRRVQFSWVAASEGAKFAQVANEVFKELKEAGPNRLFTDEGKDNGK